MASSVELLTPFNFHSWKGDMEIQLRSRGLYRVTMDIEEEPGYAIGKSRFLNKKDEAFGFLCLSVSRDMEKKIPRNREEQESECFIFLV